MVHIEDVAAYILDKRGPMTTMKLQKLCYYSFGYHLAWEGEELFPERFEAWANGPVSPTLYSRHRGRYELRAGDVPGNPEALGRGERESIDIVLENLGGLSAHDLSTMTHRELPWIGARQRAGVGPLERSTEPLGVAEIYEFFDALVSADGEE
ncbi:Panacea domain-containing protein [Nonomuraea sp. NPDC004702]